MDLNKISTESRNPNTMDIDIVSTKEILVKINNEDKKVAYVIEEKDLTHEKLSSALRELIDNPVLRKEMEENAKKLAVADSQKIIAEIIVGLV